MQVHKLPFSHLGHVLTSTKISLETQLKLSFTAQGVRKISLGPGPSISHWYPWKTMEKSSRLHVVSVAIFCTSTCHPPGLVKQQNLPLSKGWKYMPTVLRVEKLIEINSLFRTFRTSCWMPLKASDRGLINACQRKGESRQSQKKDASKQVKMRLSSGLHDFKHARKKCVAKVPPPNHYLSPTPHPHTLHPEP